MTKRELLEALKHVPEDGQILIGVMYIRPGGFGDGDFYPIDDVQDDSDLTAITCTVNLDKIPR
jgi:hypothetical protein